MIISIGEVVWDIFPEREVLGGAPLNVAYHLRCLGCGAGVITRVGDDELGGRTIAAMADLKVPVDGVQRGRLPTGAVRVTIGADNEPRFEIVTPAAWDNIDPDEAENYIGSRSFKLVFGTLAQRDERSRRAIRELWRKADYRCYDVNLRPPHTPRQIVEESLAAAELVKMNGAELEEIGCWRNLSSLDRKGIARELMDLYNIAVLVVTEGAEGAWLIAGGDYYRTPGRPVKVADTVGAGDAFFAALLAAREQGLGWQEALDRAAELGAYVASRYGATPPMPVS
ncbi:MAG: carbohydrate kinase [Desulfobulbaceae bacterium]|nr:carbohydrate kinase [Desulfobulbaceae bacterium]